jgi:hypothetical protein
MKKFDAAEELIKGGKLSPERIINYKKSETYLSCAEPDIFFLPNERESLKTSVV